MTPIEQIRVAKPEEIVGSVERPMWETKAKEVEELIKAGQVAALDITGGVQEVNKTFSGIRNPLLKNKPKDYRIYSKRIRDKNNPDKYTLLISDKPFSQEDKS